MVNNKATDLITRGRRICLLVYMNKGGAANIDDIVVKELVFFPNELRDLIFLVKKKDGQR